MSDTTIDLDRMFAPVSGGPTTLGFEGHLQLTRRLHHHLSWSELLKSRWSVVLGEAGTGKSTEFRFRPEVLRRSGTPAFFMDVTRLAKHGPKLAVDQTTLAKLELWRAGHRTGVFFLDSVDEAELRLQSLADALAHLDEYLGEARGRTSIVVSCRVSDWSSASGHHALANYIRSLGSDPQELLVVHIMPLDEARVKLLAGHFGCSDPSALIEAVREASAHPFVARPLDVKWLVEYWEEEGRVGTLTELVEASVERRLEERRPNSCPSSRLSRKRARSGLERLAGLAILSGRWSFAVRGETPGGSAVGDTLDPSQALEGWSESEIRELLTRAVFDSSTYGCVRLHHRAVQEYLAARWILELVSGGLRQRYLERLFFREFLGDVFVPTHLLATATWLSLWNEKVKRRLTDAHPEALFQHGDPAGLDVESRQAALENHLGRYSDRDQLFNRFDEAALRRFAPALDGVVHSNLGRKDLPDEAVAFLLALARNGDISSCSRLAISWSRDANASPRIRREAFTATAALATAEEKRNLVTQTLEAPDEWRHDVAGDFASCFFPSVMSPSELGNLLRRIRLASSHVTTRIKSFTWHELPEVCPASDRLVILGELCESVVQLGLYGVWLLEGLQELCRLVVEAHSGGEPPLELRTALMLLSQASEETPGDLPDLEGLRTAIASNERVRRWLFWQRAKESIDERTGQWPATLPYRYEPLSEIGIDDAQWLAADAIDRHKTKSGEFAFSTLRQLRVNNACVQAYLELVAASCSNPQWIARLDQDERQRAGHTGPSTWELERRRKDEEREQERREKGRAELEVLGRELSNISSGEQRYLLQLLRRRARLDGDSFGVDLTKMSKEFGPEIAGAAASGFVKCWRAVRVPFQFQEEDRTTISGDVELGLAGLQLEFEDMPDISHFSDLRIPGALGQGFRADLGSDSGTPGQGFRSTWARIPGHLGTDSGALGQA